MGGGVRRCSQKMLLSNCITTLINQKYKQKIRFRPLRFSRGAYRRLRGERDAGRRDGFGGSEGLELGGVELGGIGVEVSDPASQELRVGDGTGWEQRS